MKTSWSMFKKDLARDATTITPTKLLWTSTAAGNVIYSSPEYRRCGGPGILEVDDISSALFDDHGVEIAVAVEIAEGNGAEAAAIRQAGRQGAQGKYRRARRAGILVIFEAAAEVADHGIEIAVAIEVGQCRRGKNCQHRRH